MNKIEQTYIIAASPAEVWQALTDPDIIERWSGANAEFVPEVGAEYLLWDGSIYGRIVEVVPQKKLVQTWKPDNWITQDSIVTFTLTPDGKGTRVELLHENVEEWDYGSTNKGWDLYYLGAIKRMLDAKLVSAEPVGAKPAKETKAAKKKTSAKKAKATKKRVTKKVAAKKIAPEKKTARKKMPAKKKTK